MLDARRGRSPHVLDLRHQTVACALQGAEIEQPRARGLRLRSGRLYEGEPLGDDVRQLALEAGYLRLQRAPGGALRPLGCLSEPGRRPSAGASAVDAPVEDLLILVRHMASRKRTKRGDSTSARRPPMHLLRAPQGAFRAALADHSASST